MNNKGTHAIVQRTIRSIDASFITAIIWSFSDWGKNETACCIIKITLDFLKVNYNKKKHNFCHQSWNRKVAVMMIENYDDHIDYKWYESICARICQRVPAWQHLALIKQEKIPETVIGYTFREAKAGVWTYLMPYQSGRLFLWKSGREMQYACISNYKMLINMHQLQNMQQQQHLWLGAAVVWYRIPAHD